MRIRIRSDPESTNSSIKLWFTISNFMPAYLKYKYIFILHFDFRSDPEYFSSWAGSGSVEKNVGSSSLPLYPAQEMKAAAPTGFIQLEILYNLAERLTLARRGTVVYWVGRADRLDRVRRSALNTSSPLTVISLMRSSLLLTPYCSSFARAIRET